MSLYTVTPSRIRSFAKWSEAARAWWRATFANVRAADARLKSRTTVKTIAELNPIVAAREARIRKWANANAGCWRRDGAAEKEGRSVLQRVPERVADPVSRQLVGPTGGDLNLYRVAEGEAERAKVTSKARVLRGSTTTPPAAGLSLARVLATGTEREVRGVHARPDVATVTDEHVTGVLALRQKESHAVSAASTNVPHDGAVYHPIAVGIARAGPKPATAKTTLIHHPPEVAARHARDATTNHPVSATIRAATVRPTTLATGLTIPLNRRTTRGPSLKLAA